MMNSIQNFKYGNMMGGSGGIFLGLIGIAVLIGNVVLIVVTRSR